MLNDLCSAIAEYILHKLHPDLNDYEGSPVSTIKYLLPNSTDKEIFEKLVHELNFRNMETVSIEEKILLWKRMNDFCNAALHNVGGIDSEIILLNILPFQKKVNEYADLLTEIHYYSYKSDLMVALLFLANRQTFLFMNAICDLASDKQELRLISRWRDSFFAMFAINRDFRTQCNEGYHLKDRNINEETKILLGLIQY